MDELILWIQEESKNNKSLWLRKCLEFWESEKLNII